MVLQQHSPAKKGRQQGDPLRSRQPTHEGRAPEVSPQEFDGEPEQGVKQKKQPEHRSIGSLLAIGEYQDYKYAMAMPGQFYRSKDGLTSFEKGPSLFKDDMRHSAVLVQGDELFVFWTRVGDIPERILLSTIDISGDWSTWMESEATEVLRPVADWEGANEPLVASQRSVAYGPVNQLRDPAIYIEPDRVNADRVNADRVNADRVFLLYAVAGESGIAIAELHGSFSGSQTDKTNQH